jgi:STE24 endopeptidase
MISLNTFLFFYLAAYVLNLILELTTEGLNLRYAKKYGKAVPEAFKETIEQKELALINQYTLDNTRFTLVQASVTRIIFLSIILSGILPWIAEVLSGLNFVAAGLIFFSVPGLFMGLAGLPFEYYQSFVIEQRYGFNTQTIKIWLSDLVKSLLVTTIFGSILLSLLLLMMTYTGETWWIWAWALFFSFQFLMIILYPTVIAPLFNKFTPIEERVLVGKIEELAQRGGISIKGVFQMDATRRSRHTNAYFSGLGKTKRIVLFDSLIQSHKADEIIAVLAHEMGHLKKNHVKKQIAAVGLVSILLFYVASLMVNWEMMFRGFGFSVMPAYAGLFLVGILWEPLAFFLTPIGMAISRKYEREADKYAVEILKSADHLINALRKIAKENLSNLRPHPIYVWFNYSHPPLLERIKRLSAYHSGTEPCKMPVL